MNCCPLKRTPPLLKSTEFVVVATTAVNYGICLQTNEVLGYVKLSEDGICGTLVDTRLAFASALKGLATGIILLHNHPSGNANPSEADIRLTRKFRSIGELHDIMIHDHIILASTCYYSFTDNGL